MQLEMLQTAAEFAGQAQMNEAQQFFYENAGYSYAPTQPSEEGHRESARRLANAEALVNVFGWVFIWNDDADATHDVLGDDGEPLPMFDCVMETHDGTVVASLSGITFADGKDWTNDPYARVVEAELALEGMLS